MNATRWRGFTLIEVLVAVFIFALLMLAGYGSINALLRTRDGLADQNGRLRDLQFAVGLLERDLRSALARPVREGYGAREPALVGSREAIVFTRAGVANPLAQERARIERVGYRWRDQTLSRFSFAVLDRTPATLPLSRELLADVRRLGFRYFDGQQWREQWPPPNLSPQPMRALPRAVEFSFDIGEFGVIRRWVDLPEVDEVAPTAASPPPGLPQ
ncbi:MAG: type II secretion system minor pseudopilin GspJ [Rhodanobacteraceae bacterium]|jgi:general secretion pathway protein J|nr:type II secretion system minor pseudopilin GspJ [Rhodanobacteraceae bacterium]MBK7043827.1 type II secretion system minor pseudopilin GspJ [Rhodanobacteraceae bacterium]MBP9155097.1 type II secretion system minor pseudopilin GspJ [Xanthomonadales bacterium]